MRDTGVLFVGKSELLIRHSERFEPISLEQPIFRKMPRGVQPDRYAFVAAHNGDGADTSSEPFPSMRDAARDAAPVAQIALDKEGFVVLINRPARALFGLKRKDVGRPLADLEISYRPAELRAPIERAVDERRSIHVGTVELQSRRRSRAGSTWTWRR